MSALVVLVLGGNGFIGRHAVAALLANGHRVVVGGRCGGGGGSGGSEISKVFAAKSALPNPAYDHIQLRLHSLPADLSTYLNGVDVVLNCVGILRERRGESYEAVHHQAPAAISRACAAANVRYVHVSALGLLANASSRFLSSKRHGEAAVAKSGADYIIVRPSLLIGGTHGHGLGSRWLQRVASWPIHFVPAAAEGRIAALNVADLATALATLCEVGSATLAVKGAKPPREVELGGSETFNMHSLLARLRKQARPAVVVKVPALLVRLVAHVCDALHVTPLSWGHVELMRRDNRPAINALPILLGHAPAIIGYLHADRARKNYQDLKQSGKTAW